MYITGEQYNRLRLLANQATNYKESKDSNVVNSIGIYLNNILNEIHKEPKVCALCKKDSNAS